MTSTNLASLIAPNILYKKNAGAILSDSMTGNIVLDLIINNHAALFKDIPKQPVLEVKETAPSTVSPKPTPREEIEEEPEQPEQPEQPEPEQPEPEHPEEQPEHEEEPKSDGLVSETPEKSRKRITKRKSLRKKKELKTGDEKVTTRESRESISISSKRPRSGSKASKIRSSRDKSKKDKDAEKEAEEEIDVEIDFQPPQCEWQAFEDSASGSWYYHRSTDDVTIWECPEEYTGLFFFPTKCRVSTCCIQ